MHSCNICHSLCLSLPLSYLILQGLKTSRPDTNTSSWYNLALISDTATYSGNTNSYSMLLTQLETDSQYEVRLRAMNKHGWSSLSEPFLFNTASEYSVQPSTSLPPVNIHYTELPSPTEFVKL